MKKKLFQSPEMSVIFIESADIVRTSGENELHELDEIGLKSR